MVASTVKQLGQGQRQMFRGRKGPGGRLHLAQIADILEIRETVIQFATACRRGYRQVPGLMQKIGRPGQTIPIKNQRPAGNPDAWQERLVRQCFFMNGKTNFPQKSHNRFEMIG